MGVGRQFGGGDLPCHFLRGAGFGGDDHLGFFVGADARLGVAVVRQGRVLRDQHAAAAADHALRGAVDADDRVGDPVDEHGGVAGQAGGGYAERGGARSR